ncbi:MAG: hypothetical protein LBC80_02950 [Treponema sp.]|jgi:hypothetical protein|nr:hypothetical protein [Treponema sp.]
MKHKCIILLMMLFVFAPLPVQAQLFKPFTSFRVIKTEYFDIIFPLESETSARQLASYADRLYEQMSQLLGIEVPGRIPVTFVPHTDMFNGYYNPVPYPHIVLFDTPMDLEWTSFADNLEGLFIHELAHAISLNTRGPFFRFLQSIFGYWVTPAAFNTPAFMIEGVTIAFESLAGFGRSNDPRIKQILRQAIHEDRFPSPFQVSGVYDYPGQRGNWYEYGGIFSTWLIQNYGMEKYAELWQAMGRSKYARSSFFVYRSGFYSIFKNVYAMDFLDVWNDFKHSLALNNLEENPDEVFPVQKHFFSERRNTISALAAGNRTVYVLSGSEGKIHAYDTITGSVRNFNSALFVSNDLDVSAGEDLILVSGYQLTGDRYKAIVIEHDAFSGRRTGRSIQGLYKARYFRDGVIGIRSQLHNTNIVYEDFNGNSEILFSGSETLMFSGPQALDNDRIVFIAARNGIRELLLYNYASKELFRIESFDENGESDNKFMRGLGVSDGKIFFGYNADDRMYKLSYIDIETMQAVFSGRDFSGGVFNPVSVDGTVYYRGIFFSGDGFLRFPETTSSMSGTRVEIKLVNVNNENSQAAAPDEYSLPSNRYLSLSYMNPFKFWFPLPLIRANTIDDKLKLSADGAGLFSLMMDATDRHLIVVMAYADITYRMAVFENFLWENTVMGFPLLVNFSDKIMSNTANELYRDTRLTLTGSFIRYPGRWYYATSLSAGYVRQASYIDGKSAYEWDETGNIFFYGAGLLFSNNRRRQHEMFGTGFTFNLRGLNIVDSFEPRFDGVLRANAEIRFPLSLTLYGAYDKSGMDLHGGSIYGQPVFIRVASEEYASGPRSHTWLAGGEVSAGLFSFEIQNNFSHVYFNRFFGALALRSVLYDSDGQIDAEGIKINDLRLAQSLVLKMGLVSSVIPFKPVPFFLEPDIWAAWKFSNTINGEGNPWGFGLGFNLRY